MEEQSNRPNALTAEKNKALAAALAHIEKQFGKGSVMRLGDHEVVEDIQVVSTGSLGLDLALGVGGLPRGRVSKSTGRNRPAKPRLPCKSSPKCRRKAAPAHLSTPSTRSTFNMHRNSALPSPIC